MVSSYEDIQGEAMDVQDHPSHNVPQASQHYAGDVLPIAGEKSMGPGMSTDAVDYALGKKKDPKVNSIGMSTLRGWAGRQK